jgi:hypothetical protein
MKNAFIQLFVMWLLSTEILAKRLDNVGDLAIILMIVIEMILFLELFLTILLLFMKRNHWLLLNGLYIILVSIAVGWIFIKFRNTMTIQAKISNIKAWKEYRILYTKTCHIYDNFSLCYSQ